MKTTRAYIAARYAGGVGNYDHPIQQIARRSGTRFQLGFATEAMERIPATDGFLLAPSREGLHVLARNEDGLADPVDTLRDVYGEALEVSPPRVRLIEGLQVQEPIMHVRVTLPPGDLPAVKQATQARGVVIEQETVRGSLAALRFEAPLARLIGLPGELRWLTAGRARYWIVLSHYALVVDGPGGRAA